jgi:hypothetical protein
MLLGAGTSVDVYMSSGPEIDPSGTSRTPDSTLQSTMVCLCLACFSSFIGCVRECAFGQSGTVSKHGHEAASQFVYGADFRHSLQHLSSGTRCDGTPDLREGFDAGPPQVGAGPLSFWWFSLFLLVFRRLPAGFPTLRPHCSCGGVSVGRSLLVVWPGNGQT